MKKEYKKENHVGFSIGQHIQIHNRIDDPAFWFLTVRLLSIFGESLCPKSFSEKEIARHVHLVLNKKLVTIEKLISDVIPFT